MTTSRKGARRKLDIDALGTAYNTRLDISVRAICKASGIGYARFYRIREREGWPLRTTRLAAKDASLDEGAAPGELLDAARQSCAAALNQLKTNRSAQTKVERVRRSVTRAANALSRLAAMKKETTAEHALAAPGSIDAAQRLELARRLAGLRRQFELGGDHRGTEP